MKFKVKREQFLQGLFPAENIATKNPNKDFESSEKITLEVSVVGIHTFAHGGTASVVSLISGSVYGDLQYDCEEEGTVTVMANDLSAALLSFPPASMLEVVLEDNELIFETVTAKKKHRQIQTVTTQQDKVDTVEIATKFDKVVKVNREVLLEGIKKVQFAMGEFETQSYYMCQLFEASRDKVRFAAGSGARFAINDINGKKIVSLGDNDKETFIFPKHNISNIIDILGYLSVQQVYVKEASEGKNSPAQIIIEPDGGDMTIVLLGLDKSINYPPLDKILGHKYPYNIPSDMGDWKWATAGISATNTKEVKKENDIIISEVSADFAEEIFVIKTETKNRSERTVKFSSDVINNENSSQPLFRCNALYLQEMVDKGGNEGNEITIHFEGKSADPDAKQRPIVIKFPDKENQTKDTTEKFSIFFAASKR